MEKFLGVPCPICGKEFSERDDIVVCPDCGAPHHRACYKEHGRCAFDEQHAQGVEWKNPKQISVPLGGGTASAEAVQCPRCDAKNSTGSRYCISCGASLSPDGGQESAKPESVPDYRAKYQSENGYQKSFGEARQEVALNDEIGGVSVKEVAQYVGENAFYYLPRFKLLELQKNIPSINISAMVFTFLYYFHRKMYKIGSAMLALFLLTLIPQLMLFYYEFPQLVSSFLSQNTMELNVAAYPNLMLVGTIFRYLFMILSVMSGFFANRIYFDFVMKNVRNIKEEYHGRPEAEYAQALAIRGRTNKMMIVAVLATFIVAYIVFLVVLMSAYPIL